MSWTVNANVSNDNNVVVHLNNGIAEINLGSNELIKPGYPLFSQWATPIVSFADANHDGVIEPNEIRYGDSLVYAGQADPKYQLNLNTTVTLLNGRLSLTAGFAYQNGMTQMNLGAVESGALTSVLGGPHVPLATQAAIVAATCVVQPTWINGCTVNNQVNGSLTGLIQQVNTLRFNTLSINYTVPTAAAHWFRVPRMTVALQGQNLGLRTNYRGIDPDVNSFATVNGGDETADLGQIPEPRVWWLKLMLGD